MHNFVVHSNESACRKIGRLGLDQVKREIWVGEREECLKEFEKDTESSVIQESFHTF